MPIFPVPGLGDGLLGLVLAFLITVALVPLAIRLAWRVGAIDRPGGNKIHARVTPLMGGVAIALSFLAVAILLPSLHPHGYNRGLVGLLAGCAMATLIGVADEIWSLRPRWHFLGQVACVVVALVIGFPRIQQVSNPHGNSSMYLSALLGVRSGLHDSAPVLTALLGIGFTVFWLVGMMNTINFLDGLDGLAGGVAAIATLFLGLWAAGMAHSGYVTYDNQNLILPLILCGALLGFLVFNWAPARIFMGDSGAMCVGFTLGALCIFGPVKLGTALMLLVVPILDVAWAVIRRLLSGHSFASGDKHHIYHRMLEGGMSRRTVVLSFYILCTALGLIDLQLVKMQKLLVLMLMGLLAVVGAFLVEYRGRRAAAARRLQEPEGSR